MVVVAWRTKSARQRRIFSVAEQTFAQELLTSSTAHKQQTGNNKQTNNKRDN